MMKYTEERDWLVNFGLFVLAAICFVLIPIVLSLVLFFIKGNAISLISNFAYIALVFWLYYKDLIREAKTYKANFKKCFGTGFKYYIAGLLAMVFFNLILSFIIKETSANENAVREMLYSSPIYTMISISIIAPLSEELFFRKSVGTLTKNKWIFALISGILFGGAHLLAGEITLSTLLYILPYGSLGFVFALMDYETKSTWTSIVIHSIHNTVTGILLLIVYFSGVMG